MEDYREHYLVPEQEKGVQKNISFSIISESVEDAEDLFIDAKNRLLEINQWKKYCIACNAGFTLFDNHGKEAHRHAKKGDYIKIDLYSEGNITTGMYDWAEIYAIEYDDYPDEVMETIAMHLYPTRDTKSKKQAAVKVPMAPSGTFVIERIGKRLTSYYHGRNEMGGPGIDEGVWKTFSDDQWKSLITTFINFDANN